MYLWRNRRWTDSPSQKHHPEPQVQLPFRPLELAAIFLKPGSGKCLTLGTLYANLPSHPESYSFNWCRTLRFWLVSWSILSFLLLTTYPCEYKYYKWCFHLRCNARADDGQSMVSVAPGEASRRWRVSRVGGPAGAGASNLEDVPSSWRKPPTRPPLAGPYAFSRIPRPVWTHPRVFLPQQPAPTWLFENVVAGYGPSHQPHIPYTFCFSSFYTLV